MIGRSANPQLSLDGGMYRVKSVEESCSYIPRGILLMVCVSLVHSLRGEAVSRLPGLSQTIRILCGAATVYVALGLSDVQNGTLELLYIDSRSVE